MKVYLISWGEVNEIETSAGNDLCDLLREFDEELLKGVVNEKLLVEQRNELRWMGACPECEAYEQGVYNLVDISNAVAYKLIFPRWDIAPLLRRVNNAFAVKNETRFGIVPVEYRVILGLLADPCMVDAWLSDEKANSQRYALHEKFCERHPFPTKHYNWEDLLINFGREGIIVSKSDSIDKMVEKIEKDSGLART